uniref:ATP synthase subunit delta, chloroplastic n=1 Tax=Melanthalia intermedia TaxID=172989 RepID=A0A345UAQ3_9FLOR|nr:ATP synthase CF1 subunit delta [Melanthalia intermedia]AXI97539.1 ATP synthase CF1 subunit delta [Melanthalia intermedia]
MSTNQLLSKISTPYAEALLDSARDSSVLTEINQDLSLISNILSRSEELKTFFGNPLISIESKKDAVNTLFADQLNNLTLRFLFLLIERRRISFLAMIIDKYFSLFYQFDLTIIAEILTPIALTELQQAELIAKIKSITSSRTVKLVIKLDQNLIAGFVIKLGSKVIDTSLQGKLKDMSYYLNSV